MGCPPTDHRGRRAYHGRQLGGPGVLPRPLSRSARLTSSSAWRCLSRSLRNSSPFRSGYRSCSPTPCGPRSPDVCVMARDPAATPGTVNHCDVHAACLREIARLRAVLEAIAEECAERADADCVGDPPHYVPNIWMQIQTRIREVIRH